MKKIVAVPDCPVCGQEMEEVRERIATSAVAWYWRCTGPLCSAQSPSSINRDIARHEVFTWAGKE